MSKKHWWSRELRDEEWMFFEWVSEDLWSVSDGGMIGDGKASCQCKFSLQNAPDDLRNWILLGTAMQPNTRLQNLPNYEKYTSVGPYSTIMARNEIYEIRHQPNGELLIYLPSALIKQIKPIKETK